MINANGNTNNSRFLDCPSDYGPIDATARAPSPKWPDQLARFTWSLTWQDANECSNSLTIRADDLPTLLEDLKLVKRGIMMAKAKAKGKAEPARQAQTDVPAETGDVPVCKSHGITMTRRVSKRTSGHYWAHGQRQDICFGRVKS